MFKSQPQKPFVPGDNSSTSTDKYYRGNNSSVVNNKYAPNRRSGGSRPAVQQHSQAPNDFNTDKFYRAGYDGRTSQQIADQANRNAPRPVVNATTPPTLPLELEVAAETGITTAALHCLGYFHRGGTQARVLLGDGMLPAFVAAVDMLVTQNRMTPEQRRAILVKVKPAKTAIDSLGKVKSMPQDDLPQSAVITNTAVGLAEPVDLTEPVDPATVPVAEEEDEPELSREQMHAIINGEADEDDDFDTD